MTILDASPKSTFQLDPEAVPRHVAIIMDGNRRWAKQNDLPAELGHWEGAKILTEIVQTAAECGVKTLTVYTFSTENWARPQEEIDSLMALFELYLETKCETMVKEGIHLNTIGDLSRLPLNVRRALQKTKTATEHCEKINLVLALNYGGRDEIKRAVGRILMENEKKKILPEDLSEEFIAQYLDTTPWGDPDLLIRTGGEMRLSNFMLWQVSYTEFYVTDVFWPQFTRHNFFQALHVYQTRQRRYGGTL